MASITHKGNPITTVGNLPPVGSKAPDFRLTKADLSDVGLDAFTGKKKVVNIVPSLDTSVCALSAKKFNEKAAGLTSVVVLNVSADLPFAAKRFCDSNSLGNVVALSTMRGPSFGQDYGVTITSGLLAGILSRAVVVLSEDNTVLYAEQVPEIAQEPNYDAVWKALS